MAAPTDPANLDDAIRRYLSGEPMTQITAATGVGGSVLFRERARRGIPPRRNLPLPSEDIAAAYRAGESEYSLSLRYKVSRLAIRKRLTELGVEIRGRSEAGKVRARRMTPAERLAQARPSHDALRGTKQPVEALLARAQQRERRGLCDSPGELRLLGDLRNRGLDPTPQKAIGKYNVDLAVAPIAMEVLGGGWHFAKRHHAVRTPAILNEGWCLLFIWNHEGDSALTSKAADYVVTFLNEVRRNPSLVGEYRVIAGNGQFLARGCADDDEFPLVKPPRGRVA